MEQATAGRADTNLVYHTRGDPGDLGARYRALAASLPCLSVLGGCCGTDIRHIRLIASAAA